MTRLFFVRVVLQMAKQFALFVIMRDKLEAAFKRSVDDRAPLQGGLRIERATCAHAGLDEGVVKAPDRPSVGRIRARKNWENPEYFPATCPAVSPVLRHNKGPAISSANPNIRG